MRWKSNPGSIRWKGCILSVLKENIREVLESESGEQIVEIDRRLEELQQEFL